MTEWSCHVLFTWHDRVSSTQDLFSLCAVHITWTIGDLGFHTIWFITNCNCRWASLLLQMTFFWERLCKNACSQVVSDQSLCADVQRKSNEEKEMNLSGFGYVTCMSCNVCFCQETFAVFCKEWKGRILYNVCADVFE